MGHDLVVDLFERWQDICARNAQRWALRAENRMWTFADLQAELELRPPLTGPVILQGRGPDFLLSTLQAWRDGQLAVPLDDGVALDLAESGLKRLPARIAHVKTTSGSTGSPRHVLFTADQLAADVDQIVATMGLRPEWPNIGVISLAHSYGFSNLVLPLLLHGIPLVLIENPLPETMRRALAGVGLAVGVTIPAVPAMWRTWHSAGILDASKVKLGISAGAPLSLKMEHAIFDACGLKVHNFLGASECGGIAYDGSDVPRAEDSQWIGSAMKGVRLSVNADGALRVSSAAAGEAYWPQPDPALSGDSHFQTNDLVRLEEHREVHLLGRADDVINVSGRKVHPGEIEFLLNDRPEVAHAVVFGIASSDPMRGEEVVAIVHLREGVQLSKIKRALAEELREVEWKLPRRWKMDAQLLPDQRGKISRALWKARFLAEN